MKIVEGSPVIASWFYIHEADKIKGYWFLYEYACTLYDRFKRSKSKALSAWMKKHSDERLAEFCAYFAKRMRKSINDKLDGLTDATEIDEEYISDYFHTNTPRENQMVMGVAGEAWEELLSVCVSCPHRCISESERRCEFFDRMERGGCFS